MSIDCGLYDLCFEIPLLSDQTILGPWDPSGSELTGSLAISDRPQGTKRLR